MGLFNYARNTVPGYSVLAAPLYRKISQGNAEGIGVSWTEEDELRLTQLKTLIQEAQDITTRVSGKSLEAYFHIGEQAAVVVVKNKGDEMPIKNLGFNFTSTEKQFCYEERMLTALTRVAPSLFNLAQEDLIEVFSDIPGLATLTKGSLINMKALKLRWDRWVTLLADPRIIFTTVSELASNLRSKFLHLPPFEKWEERTIPAGQLFVPDWLIFTDGSCQKIEGNPVCGIGVSVGKDWNGIYEET